ADSDRCAGGCYRRARDPARNWGGAGRDESFCRPPPLQAARGRSVRRANFITPRSGGLRPTPPETGAGDAAARAAAAALLPAAGHEPVLIMPGAADQDEQTPQGRVITLRAPVLPLSGGYRLLLSRRRVSHLLEALQPDRLEVSDRTTLRWTGQWARSHSVPTV